MAKQTHDFDLIVIGGGVGGTVAAHLVASTGKRVGLVEGDALGGTSPNWGCIPTKSLLHAAHIFDEARQAKSLGIRSDTLGYNFPQMKAWKDKAIQRSSTPYDKRYHQAAGITVIEGNAHFISPESITVNRRHFSARQFLIATGSHLAIPNITGLEQTGYLTYQTALDLFRPPKTLFIIGAGSFGCEMAELFSIFGTRVYLADIAPRLLPNEDLETSELVSDIFTQKRGMTLLTSSKILQVAKEGLLKKVTFQRGGEEHTVKVNEILLATGMMPNTDIGLENADVEYLPKGIIVDKNLLTSNKNIYAIGDVTGGYNYNHVATYESRVAAHNILHRDKVAADYKAVPRVTFLSPEIASVGMSEEDCHRADIRTKIALAPISIIGRSNTSDFRDGFVKIIANQNGQIIGATVICPSAGEVVHELTIAIQYGLIANEIANTIHAFPTWSEAVRVACAKI